MKYGAVALLVVAAVALAADAATADLAPPVPMASWPSEPTPKPAPDEWTGATVEPMVRPSEGCAIARVREWLRVSCRFGDALLTGVRVLSGPTDDVEIGDRTPEKGQPSLDQWGQRRNHGLTVTFPVRRGQKRLIEVVQTVFESRYTIGEDAAAIISAVWLTAEAGPTLVIH